MNRRGFFGVAAGAAVAGPSMAKEAANQITKSAAMNAGGLVGAGVDYGLASIGETLTAKESPLARATRKLMAFKNLTADHLREAREHVATVRSEYDLDPDLSSYKSMSLSARLSIQTERNVQRFIEERRGFWQRLFDNGGEHPRKNSPFEDPFW